MNTFAVIVLVLNVAMAAVNAWMAQANFRNAERSLEIFSEITKRR